MQRIAEGVLGSGGTAPSGGLGGKAPRFPPLVASKKFLIAVTPLYQKQLKSRFRGNFDEDPPPATLKFKTEKFEKIVLIDVLKNICF